MNECDGNPLTKGSCQCCLVPCIVSTSRFACITRSRALQPCLEPWRVDDRRAEFDQRRLVDRPSYNVMVRGSLLQIYSCGRLGINRLPYLGQSQAGHRCCKSHLDAPRYFSPCHPRRVQNDLFTVNLISHYEIRALTFSPL